MKQLLIVLMLALAMPVLATPAFETTMDDDKRKVRTASSPTWLAAVGRLKVNNKQNTAAKSCTLFLISLNKTDDSRIGLTAAHCISDFRIKGGVGPESFSPTTHNIYFTTNDGREIKRKIVSVEGYDYSEGDYAIVTLNQTILNSDIQPLVHSDEKFKSQGYGLLDDPLYKVVFEPFATATGYSTDTSPEFGNKGENLTYHEDCYLNGGTNGQKDSKCTSYGGASGGPIAVTVDRGIDEWEERPTMGTEHLVVGIIKGGREGNNTRTYWTPATYYDKKLKEVFKKYGIKRVTLDS